MSPTKWLSELAVVAFEVEVCPSGKTNFFEVVCTQTKQTNKKRKETVHLLTIPKNNRVVKDKICLCHGFCIGKTNTKFNY